MSRWPAHWRSSRSILLLDEPFAALDKNLRLDMQIEVKRLQRVSGITTLIVTHDQEEALSMADRVAVLSHGKLEQFGSPSDVYDRPQTLFVNTFVGASNRMPGVVVSADRTAAKVRLDAGAEIIARPAGGALTEGGRVTVCIRPEHLQFVGDETGFAGVVGMSLPLGATVVHEVTTADGSGVKISQARIGETRTAGERRRGAPCSARPIARQRFSCNALDPVFVQREFDMIMNRRSLMTTALTLGAMKAFPGLSFAQARPLVFATFTGSWEEAHKAVLVPAFRKANADAAIVLDPMLSVDQIAKVNAAKANPPIDVMLHDPGPALVAIGQDLVEPYPVEKSAYYKDLISEAQEPMGPAPFFQVVGLTYNPEAVKTPPTSWADLWKPEFKGRVGITNLNSTLGTGWLVEIAKMRGGSEANVDPGFKALEELKPNLAAVAANPGALATLFQQGQIDISPGNFNAIQILKARGVPVEFVAPKEGAIAFKTTIHIVKNSPNRELAFKLIEAALTPEVQTTLMNPPYLIVPTNSKVTMGGEIARVLAKDTAELKQKFVFQDWKKINEQRSAWIERFNREIKI